MAQTKTETVTIRTSKEVKDLLRLAADHERRSIASTVEILIRDYAERNHLASSGGKASARTR